MMNTYPHSIARAIQRPSHTPLARRIVFALLKILAGVLIAIIALPVPLLFVNTSVPLYISIPLALADLGLVVALFRFERTPLALSAFILGVIAVSLLAIWMSQVFATTPPITDARGKPLPNSIAPDLDFTTEAAKVDMPMYFLVGRRDVNAMASLVERYYSLLDAPHKELIWLDSAHGAGPDEILDAMVNRVLPQTHPEAPALTGPTNGPSDAREVEAFLDELMPTQLRENHIAGAAVAVVKDGQLLFSKGYGYADLESRRPATDRTLFRTDSTGKLFVWTAVMQLVEPQLLRLADGALNAHGDLVFDVDEQDRVSRLFVANNPYRAYEKVTWYEAVDVQRIWLVLCILLFLSLLIAVPLAGLVRWISPTTGIATSNLGQWLLAGACLLALVFLLGLALTLKEALLYGVTPALIGVLTLPILALVLAAASLFFVRNGWDAMGMVARLHYAAILVAMIAYGWWLYEWNLLGFRF
jgi:hypothetical protein